MEHHEHPAHRDGPGYEVSDTRARPLVVAVVGLAVSIAIVLAVVSGMVRALAVHDLPDPNAVPPTNLYQQRDHLNKDEDAALHEYALDRKAGTARIPIERAMDLIAERGAPQGGGPRTEVQLNSRDQGKGGKTP